VYVPSHLEQLERARDEAEAEYGRAVRTTAAVLNEQLLRGDYFMCASEKQRDFWLGHLASLGRVNRRTYDGDEGLRSLIDVVPFGIDDSPPVRNGPGAKGVIPGIDHGDDLVLWGGGIYNWFDPLSLVNAIERLRHRRPRVRLLFMGGQHPNPKVTQMQRAVQARELAQQLGILGSHVFFNEEWVPYAERQNFLLDADVAVSTHFDHIETAFSFRTRVLDYLWASVPVVATSGDAMADLIDVRGVGLTVAPQSVHELDGALGRILEDSAFAAQCRTNAASLAPELRWGRVLRPLFEFCAAPRRAPDLVDPRLGPTLARARRAAAPPHTRGVRHDAALIAEHLRAGGPRLLLRRVGSRLRRTVKRHRTDEG
jgi:glycosyltransferase involved in cell wall biosynthesis